MTILKYSIYYNSDHAARACLLGALYMRPFKRDNSAYLLYKNN